MVISEKTYEVVADKVKISQQFTVCLKGVEENRTFYEVDSVMSHWSCLPVSKR